jgi:hypothetical protein
LFHFPTGDFSNYSSSWGKAVNLEVLAYAIDDHAQAVLTRVVDDVVLSQNAFTHISVSVSNIPPYTAVRFVHLSSRFCSFCLFSLP